MEDEIGTMEVSVEDTKEEGGQFEGAEPGWYYYRIGQPADEPMGPYGTEEEARSAGMGR